ncbi:MAG: DUF2723 domain-containing protein [Chloroflexota bacterium]
MVNDGGTGPTDPRGGPPWPGPGAQPPYPTQPSYPPQPGWGPPPGQAGPYPTGPYAPPQPPYGAPPAGPYSAPPPPAYGAQPPSPGYPPRPDAYPTGSYPTGGYPTGSYPPQPGATWGPPPGPPSDAAIAAAEPEPSWLWRALPWLIPALVVFVVSLSLDLRTIMPGLGYWDTAEFQTLGPVLGIAHPTGYPSYTLLLWLASVVLQPFGEAAFRANLLSSLLISGAAALTAIAVVQLTRKPLLGIASGIALAVAPIAWGNAVRADPHTFQVFLVGLLLVLLVAWAQRERAHRPKAGRWLIAASVAFALAVTNHGLTVALAPGVAVYVLLVSPRILWQQWKLVLACVATLAILIVGIYAYLPVRSSMNPPLDYAHPADWVRTNREGEVTGGFKYLVLGEQFGGRTEVPPLSTWPDVMPERIVSGSRIVADVLREQFGSGALLDRIEQEANDRGIAPADPITPLRVQAVTVPGTGDDLPLDALGWPLLVILGVPLGLLRRPREVVMTGLWFVGTFVLAMGYPNADITRYYLGPLLIACVWAALALDAIWAGVRVLLARLGGPPEGRDLFRGGLGKSVEVVLAVLVGAVLLSPVAAALPERFDQADASTDDSAHAWVDATLAALPQDAVVVSWWSYSTPLWYAKYVEGQRPDITIIDDRTIVDQDLGNVPGAIAKYIQDRPVYAVRLDQDLGEILAQYDLEPVPGIPGGQAVYRVIDRTGPG